MSETEKRCTCPSGDGSLRWPCPSHPAAPSAPQGGGVDGRAIAQARDAWQNSDEGRMLANDINGPVGGQYLRNRLEVAFCAGYEAALTAQPRTDAAQQGEVCIRCGDKPDSADYTDPLSLSGLIQYVRVAADPGQGVMRWHAINLLKQALPHLRRLEELTTPPSAPAQVAGDAVPDWSDGDQTTDGEIIESRALKLLAEQYRADGGLAAKLADHIEVGRLHPVEARACRAIAKAYREGPLRQAAAPSAPVRVEGVEAALQKWLDWCVEHNEEPEARSGARIAIEALTQQPAAVDEADTRRLEWLIANELLVHRLSDTGLWMVTTGDLSPAIDGSEHDTWREAIDDALAGQQQENGNG